MSRIRAIPLTAFGDVTARWLWLTDEERDRHAMRLLGVPYAEEAIGRTTAATPDQYRRLVDHAADGDSIAFAWLAVRHTSLLINRGRVLDAIESLPVEHVDDRARPPSRARHFPRRQPASKAVSYLRRRPRPGRGEISTPV